MPTVRTRRTKLIRVGGLLLCMLLVGLATGSAVEAGSAFHFSTGDPDGKIATASRPGGTSGADQETESADDFPVTAPETLIQHATFIGLVPAGVSVPADISQVRIEIYRIFPKDSDTSRTSGPPTFSTSQVPTRVNSPSDVEFDDRDSAAGNLIFTATVLSDNFAALNSVDTGIHPKPNQTTGGDGAVSGQEVLFDVTFLKAFNLPPDHYFFVPQVLLSDPSDHFLWLSAPKPIVPPGTSFSSDLQSWIRNAQLDPDWLRIGTDIVGSGTFNGTFSLDGETTIPAPALSRMGLAVLGLLLVVGVPVVVKLRRASETN
jgi:hypothetical protein